MRIDRRPSGPVRDQNASGLFQPDVFKGDGQAGALDSKAAEIPSGIITGDAAGAGIAQAELGLPDRARVPVDEAHAEVPRILVAVRIRLRERPAPGGPAGERRAEAPGCHARDRIGQVAAAIVPIESGGLDGKRDPVPWPQLPIEGGAGRLPLRQARKVPDEKVGEIGLVGGSVGQRSPIGRRRGAAPGRLDEGGRLVLGRAAAGERKAEAFADGLHVRELEARLDLGRRAAARTRGTREAAVAIAHQQVGADIERGPRAIEGGAYDEVHGPGEGAAGGIRRRGKADLDAREVVGRDIGHLDIAGRVGLGARLLEAVHRHRGVVRGHPVQLDVHRLPAHPGHLHARDRLEQFAD